jgi:hypothetical protein
MRLHSLIGNLCLIASIALLVVAHGPASDWPALIAISAVSLLLILLRNRITFLGASVLLCSYLALAIRDILLQDSVFPLVLGTVTALIWWDLAEHEHRPRAGLLAGAENALTTYRLQSLAITAGASTLLLAAGIWLHVRLPLGVIVVLVLVITGGLSYVVRILRNPPLGREGNGGSVE